MESLFRLASGIDTDEILVLFFKAIERLRTNDIDQWDDQYPNRYTIAEDIEKGQMYVLSQNGQIVSAVVLNEEQPKAYGSAAWSDRYGRVAVIHRLCVHPDFQGMGIGRYTLGAGEKFLADIGYTSIRLDAFMENRKAITLYESLGYTLTGKEVFRKGEFGLYEKLLSD